jgi:hypothetical protein
MAPERFSVDLTWPPIINGPSKKSDVYSLVMTSFEVCSSAVTLLPHDTITPLWSGPHGDIAL